jgi:hypothetical protein
MSWCKWKVKLPQGIGILVFNIALFVAACVAVILLKRYQQLKVGIILFVIGVMFIIIHCILRYVFYQSYLEALKKKQNANIVPKLCPDYWTKTSKDGGKTVTCENKFLADGNGKVVSFGEGGRPYEYNLAELEKLNNQQKCNKVLGDKVPWLDMQLKCDTAGEL